MNHLPTVTTTIRTFEVYWLNFLLTLQMQVLKKRNWNLRSVTQRTMWPLLSSGSSIRQSD